MNLTNVSILDSSLAEFNWNYYKILSEKKLYTLKNKITIGIIDSGIDIHNPYVKNKSIFGSSFLSSEYTEDVTGHGTQVFGVLDTLVNGAIYKIYKVMDTEITSSLNLVNAIIAAVDDDVDIINISLGIYKDTTKKTDRMIISGFEKAINYAKQNNVLVVASSGNNGVNMDKHPHIIHLPSDLEYVINVGSSNKQGSLTKYTNFGRNLDIVAPSGEWRAQDNKIVFPEMILTYGKMSTFLKSNLNDTDIPNGLVLSYGTSLATPQIVAALAILMDKFQHLTIDEYKEKLLSNSVDIFHNDFFYKEIRIVN